MDKWKNFTDSDLRKLLQDAREYQDIRYYKAIIEEINRRIREE